MVKAQAICPDCDALFELEIHIISKVVDGWCCACRCISFQHVHSIPGHSIQVHSAVEISFRTSEVNMTTAIVRSRCTGSGSSVILPETSRG